MRINEISATNIPPVKVFVVSGLSDLVVLAGANGVGKTRLIEAFLNYFRTLTGQLCKFSIQATNDEERVAWGKNLLDTSVPQDAQLLRQILQRNRRRHNFVSSVLYFESDRSIRQIQPFQFTWDILDPWEENMSWDFTWSGLRNRWQDTLHAIFRKVQSQRNDIATRAVTLKQQGQKSMDLDFPDPLEPFKKVFSQLLGPKQLEDADFRIQTLSYTLDSQTFNINSLSSGEREVLNVAFDFLLRQPSHCIVFFDEPELHLHPELSSKLLGALRTIGEYNQFFLCTHSPDIISTSLDDSVVIIGPPNASGDPQNQAIVVKQGDDTNEALRSLGHSIGIVSLGRKIVLIEGSDASLDKQTYTQILQNRFPNLVLVPSAGKHSISSFDHVMTEILARTVRGIDFFMLCDRDAVPVDGGSASTGVSNRFRVLSKYHLENYFLDDVVLADVFRQMEPLGSWLVGPDEIRAEMREIAKSLASYATALIVARHFRELVGNIDLMPKGCHGKTVHELGTLVTETLSRVEG